MIKKPIKLSAVLPAILVMFVLTTCNPIAFSQSTGRSSFGITVGIGEPVLLQTELEGGPSVNLRTGLNVGLNYFFRLHEKIEIESGLQWSNNSMVVKPAFYPGLERDARKYELQLLNIPIFARVHFAKYFFINGGLLIDFDISKHKYLQKQNGVGAGLAMGTEIPLGKRIHLQVNPYLDFHSLINSHDGYQQRVAVLGCRIGIRAR